MQSNYMRYNYNAVQSNYNASKYSNDTKRKIEGVSGKPMHGGGPGGTGVDSSEDMSSSIDG